jgi:hypothetical protein
MPLTLQNLGGGKLEGGRHVKSADENFKLCTKLAIYGRKCQSTYTAQNWFSNMGRAKTALKFKYEI